MKHPGLSTQRGFTLIEAIVSLVLIATTGMALFSWINSNIISLYRVQEANAQSAATASALDFMASVNPMLLPQGEAALGTYQLRWRATASTPTRDGAGYPYGTSLYQVSLYDTQVQLFKPDKQLWFDFTLQQVGYKQVRNLVGAL